VLDPEEGFSRDPVLRKRVSARQVGYILSYFISVRNGKMSTPSMVSSTAMLSSSHLMFHSCIMMRFDWRIYSSAGLYHLLQSVSRN
jgi:hypothetical protein